MTRENAEETTMLHFHIFGQYIDVPLKDMEIMVLLPLIFAATMVWDRMIVHDLLWASSVHAGVVTVIAALNLWYQVNEVYIFILMAGYFLADSVRCFINGGSKIYLFHHGLTVFALWYMITQPHLSGDFYASKATMVELSTPFMNRYMTTQRMIDGVVFTIAFFGVRVAWLGYLGWAALDDLVHGVEYVIIAAFLGLNWYWFAQIIGKAYEALTGNHVPYTEDRSSESSPNEETKADLGDGVKASENVPSKDGLRQRKNTSKASVHAVNTNVSGANHAGEDPCGWVQSCGEISEKVVTDTLTGTKQAIARRAKNSNMATSPLSADVLIN